jgi:integrase
MGFTRTYNNKKSTRYQAPYLDARGVQQSAGIYDTLKEAKRAWQRAEARMAEGRSGDARRARQTFRTYVEERWLPHHRMEATTRQDYTYAIYAHLMPFFGGMKMGEITSERVREWIAHLKKEGVSAHRIKYCKVSVLNAIFTTAVHDDVVVIHPSRGVETDPVPEKPRKTLTAEQFGLIYAALPDADARLLVETDIESGLRWGEPTELRVKDLDFDTQLLTVSRAVVELTPKHHPEGKRFLVKAYPKGKRWRRIKLSAQIVHKLKAYVEAEGLGPEDLLFSRRHQPAGRAGAAGGTGSRFADVHRPQRPCVHPRHDHGLQPREVQVRSLPKRVRCLPCEASGRWQGQTSDIGCRRSGYRPAHLRELVPQARLVPGARSGRARLQAPHS